MTNKDKSSSARRSGPSPISSAGDERGRLSRLHARVPFLRYLSDNYEQAAKKELGATTLTQMPSVTGRRHPCLLVREEPTDVSAFEKQMPAQSALRHPPRAPLGQHHHMARTQDGELLNTLQAALQYIETNRLRARSRGSFRRSNLGSDKLGQDLLGPEREAVPRSITKISRGPRGVLDG